MVMSWDKRNGERYNILTNSQKNICPEKLIQLVGTFCPDDCKNFDLTLKLFSFSLPLIRCGVLVEAGYFKKEKKKVHEPVRKDPS